MDTSNIFSYLEDAEDMHLLTLLTVLDTFPFRFCDACLCLHKISHKYYKTDLYTSAVIQLFRVIMGTTDSQEILTDTIKDPLQFLTVGKIHYVLNGILRTTSGKPTHINIYNLM